ncbi:MAG: 50S ribosomal protein L5 [Candidatus Micrarchaeaceae archaeon]
MADENQMTTPYIEKVVLNIGIGQNENQFGAAKMLLNRLTGHNAVATVSKKRRPSLKLKKGQIIGAMVTLRKGSAKDMLARALDAENNTIKSSSISDNSLSFGVKEYIDFAGIKYDPKIGMLGLNVNASFSRKGKRVELRRRGKAKVGARHARVRRDEIAEYLKKNFNVKIIEEE